ncbi:MAG: TetR/AcrR family transcriptional regulator [Acidimicrobiia bacterium]|nr:TetR/AcrR family transcriptional regulator [Acidimicrobiia bacterium]
MGRPLSDEARERMLRAALEVVVEIGVPGFTIDEVARRSGVAKTTIYRHFDSRNDLLVAALDGSMSVPATPDTGSLRDDLVEFLTSVRPIFADPIVRALFLDLLAASARDPELAAMQQGMMAQRSGPTRVIYERAKRRGDISPDIGYVEAFDIMEGPFILGSLFRPRSLEHVDIEALVDKMLPQLQP